MSAEENKQLAEIIGRLKNIENMLHGEGENPGMKGELRDLKNAEENRSRLFWIAVAASFSAIASAVVTISALIVTALRSTGH